MFQQPGMSRQPMGILASSPELMNVVQQRQQPVQMAQGGPVNVNDTISNQLMAIQQLRGMGDRATLNNIAADKRLPRSVQMAAANALAGIEPKDDGPIEQVPLAQTDKLPSLTAPPVMSVRGSGDTVPVNIGSAAEQVPVSTPGGGITGLTTTDPMTRIGSSMTTDQMNRIRAARNLDPLPETSYDSLVGAARATLPEGTVTLDTLAANQAETQRLMSQGDETSAMLTDPSTLLPQISGATAEKPDEKKKAEKPKPNPTAAAEALLVDPTTLLPQISDITKADTSEKKKADAVDEALNITGTRKERTEQRYQMLKDLLGEDKAKDIRTDANYNLMMAGLMIAAGESPDAATNIAKGLAAGLKGYGEATGEAAQEASKEEKALKLMAAKEVGEEMTAEQAAAIRAAELADTRGFQRELKEEEADLRIELANMPPADLRTLQAVADAGRISLYEAFKLSKAKAPSSTDTDDLTVAYAKQYPNLSPAQARILAGVNIADYGTPVEAIKELFGIEVTQSGAKVQQGVSVDVKAHQAANTAAKQAGESTYTLGDKTFKVQ